MKKMILLVVILVAVSITAMAVVMPDMMVFKAKNGDVTFFHTQHSGIACVDCHHTEDYMVKCSDCHKTKVPTGDFHKFCIDCHKENKMNVSCASCHKR